MLAHPPIISTTRDMCHCNHTLTSNHNSQIYFFICWNYNGNRRIVPRKSIVRREMRIFIDCINKSFVFQSITRLSSVSFSCQLNIETILTSRFGILSALPITFCISTVLASFTMSHQQFQYQQLARLIWTSFS